MYILQGSTTKKSKAEGTTYVSTEHVLSLLSSLLTSLSSDSPSRLRLLTKFVENDYEKIDRLIELREEIETRVNLVGEEEKEEGLELDEEDLYLERLEKGLFSLQRVDYIVAWLCMEDDGVSFLLFSFLPVLDFFYRILILTLLIVSSH